MVKKRVYEVAQELGMSSVRLLELLQSQGVHVKSASSTLTQSEVAAVRNTPAPPSLGKNQTSSAHRDPAPTPSGRRTRVWDVARTFNVWPKEVLDKLATAGMPVNGPDAFLSPEQVEALTAIPPREWVTIHGESPVAPDIVRAVRALGQHAAPAPRFRPPKGHRPGDWREAWRREFFDDTTAEAWVSAGLRTWQPKKAAMLARAGVTTEMYLLDLDGRSPDEMIDGHHTIRWLLKKFAEADQVEG